MPVNSSQAGQLGHYTWIIDEIILEEARPNQKEASSYEKPFSKVKNSQGIEISSLSEQASKELFNLLASLIGLSYNIPRFSSIGNLQVDRIQNENIKKNMRRIKSSLVTLENSEFVKDSYGDEEPSPPQFNADPN